MREKPGEAARDPVPLYFQLANKWRLLILSEEWPAGGRVPTEHELADKYGVSRLTVRKAKDYLIREGLLRSIQGSGSYVTGPEQWKTQPDPFLGTLDDIFEFGQQTSFELLDFGLMLASEAIAEKLKRPHDRYVYRIRGVRSFNGRPISHVVYHFPFDVGSRIRAGSLDKGPYIPQIERMLGIEVTEGLHAFFPGSAGRDVARLLGIRQRTPVLVVESLYLDSDLRPVEFLVTQYRPDWRYRVRMRRMGPRIIASPSPASGQRTPESKEGTPR
jgi:GntR family transcriptional regulator